MDEKPVIRLIRFCNDSCCY